MSDYVELHCHSAFSLLDGASHPDVLVARALELGYDALALTDHDDLGGAVAFAQAAHNNGLEGVIGVEVTVDGRDAGEASSSPSHLTLLAESRDGYGNLASLVTRARTDRPRGHPGISLDTLAQHARGVFALTGCPRGWVPSLAAAGDPDAACEAAAVLRDIFDGRLAVECWDHGLPEERATVRHLIRLARALDLPWVVTNDVHYARAQDHVVHDVLCALRHERALDAMGTRLRPNGEWYLKSPAQMARRWQQHPEGIRATRAIAERCAFRMRELRPTLPAFPLPPGVTADEYLARLVAQGAWERWGMDIGAGDSSSGCGMGDAGCAGTPDEFSPDVPAHPASPIPHPANHLQQITHELSVIRRLGLAGYFLIVWDIVRFARREGVLCQGRGSAANSAVCFCLGITAVDPIKLGLLFERFLSEERQEAPDIDIDFAHRDREKVLQYVYERYGREHAAMVCEQITYRGKSAVRDSARVLGFSVEQANALALLSDRFSARATAEAMMPGLDTAGVVGLPEHLRLGSHLVHGTEVTNRMRAMKESERRAREAEMTRARKARPETPSDRPQPRAAYEPYGSPSAQDSGARLFDPYAGDDHVERRNPTTALREPRDAGCAGARRRRAGRDARVQPESSPSRAGASGIPHPASLLSRAGLDPRDKRVRVLPTIVAGLHQIPRHRSIHVGGFVLTAEPLSTVVPIEPAAMENRTVVQWDKDDVEAVGLVKIDLLGLGMLTLIQDCLKYIRATRGVTIDLADLDYADQAVYDDLCRADTIGIFQVESRAQMNTLPRLKPRAFYDLVVEVALIRPGPIQGEMVHPYLRRRAGEEPVTYPHASLEPILARTLGVPLFQEQGMQVAITAAGFTAGEADNLRRAMGHKRSHERMAAICERLIEGMKQNGIAEDVARRIFAQINAFADYGFPESHAASFALLVYASAYLKHYYAPEFTAAILNAQPMGFYAPGTLIEDARRHGVEVRPVDVTRSGYDCTLEARAHDEGLSALGSRPSAVCRSRGPRAESREPAPPSPPAVRLGLRLVRGLGPRAREKLQRALADGPFASIGDVVRRAGLDRRALLALAAAGALDSFVPDEPSARRRRAAVWRLLEEARGAAGPLAPARPKLAVPPSVRAMSPREITTADYRMTGVSLNGHPLRHLRALLAPNGIHTAREVLALRDGMRGVGVAGLVICRQRPGTAKGFVFLTLEDETGLVNVVVTPKRFERQALLISTAPLLLVRGTLQVEQGVVNLRGESFRALRDEVGAEGARGHDFH